MITLIVFRPLRIIYTILIIFGLVQTSPQHTSLNGSTEQRAVGSTVASPSPGKPLGELLTEDGTLNLPSGFHGSIDPTGWQLVSMKGEEPRFAELIPGDERWDDQFQSFPAGTNADVYAIVVGADHVVYLGGYFTSSGMTTTNYVASWDGNEWMQLGEGMDNVVEALALDNDGNLYAGGVFFTAGGVPANAVARWDGTGWSALGDGLDDGVLSLATDENGNLYAGGWFLNSGDVQVNYVAKWDGTDWSPLGNGMNAAVAEITVDNNGILYAGGWFTQAGGIPVNAIARWDGTTWSSLGGGVDGLVFALATDQDNNLYVGGRFETAGGINANNVARWSGYGWSNLGEGVGAEDGEAVLALSVAPDGALIAGGYFTRAGLNTAYGIARWDGSQWSNLGGNDPINIPFILTLGHDGDGYLYAGGAFSKIGDVPASNIAQWDGGSWNLLGSAGNNPNDEVFALVLDTNGLLYVAGRFEFIGDLPVNHIAKWDGYQWLPLGEGLNGYPYSIVLDEFGNLYAGGSFLSAGGISTPFIAKWDGSQWTSLGGGMNSSVMSMAIDDQGYLYAGGSFTIAGGVSANYIARWDGAQWWPLGSGMNYFVLALTIDNLGNVYAGGFFTTAGGITVNHIAMWDGYQWYSLNGGADAPVHALAVDTNNHLLYAGGEFTMIGGINANSIAVWDGNTWLPLDEGVTGGSNIVYDLRVGDNGVLFAGGDFQYAGGILVNNVARWDEEQWHGLGSGTNYPVEAFTSSYEGMLYIGGQFTMAGGKPSSYIGRWINNPPRSLEDDYDTFSDTPLFISPPGVLGNDDDADNDPISAELVTPPQYGILLFNDDGSFQYTPNAGFEGQESFIYKVDDTFGYSEDTIVTINVFNTNYPPIVDAGEDQQSDEGETVAFSGSFIDPGLKQAIITNLSPTISWDFGDGSFAVGTLTPTHTYVDDGFYTVTLVVTDAFGAAGMDMLLVTVTNVAPLLTPLPDQQNIVNQPFTITVTLTDPGLLDTHQIILDWNDGISDSVELSVGILSCDLNHTYPTSGAYTVTVTVLDKDGGWDVKTFIITVIRINYKIFLPITQKI